MDKFTQWSLISNYVKKVYRHKIYLRLVSINEKYDDTYAPYEENPRIIGKTVGHFNPVEISISLIVSSSVR